MVEPTKPSFEEYKIMKDEIVDVCEKRLQVAMNEGFKEFKKEMVEYIDKQFVNVDQRFIGIDQRFISIDQRFMSIDHRFVSIDHRFDAIDLKIDGLKSMNKMILWILGAFLTLYIASYSVLLNILMSK